MTKIKKKTNAKKTRPLTSLERGLLSLFAMGLLNIQNEGDADSPDIHVSSRPIELMPVSLQIGSCSDRLEAIRKMGEQYLSNFSDTELQHLFLGWGPTVSEWEKQQSTDDSEEASVLEGVLVD